MADEDIIKKRLLIDGDGTGDDRRLNMLLKQFLKWTYSKNDTPENSQVIYDRLMAQLAQCEFAAAKNQKTMKMIEEEQKNYDKLSGNIQKSIELAEKEIEESKKELVVAKEIRKNKMEYDLLARQIMNEPDRDETKKNIEVTKKELSSLNTKKEKLEAKFQKRRNDFTVLMYAIRELESQLEEESSDSDMEITKEADEEEPQLMDVSDDEMPTPPKLSKESYEVKTGSDQLDFKMSPLSDRDDLKDNSIDEDTVLELSIEKDEAEDVKLVDHRISS